MPQMVTVNVNIALHKNTIEYDAHLLTSTTGRQTKTFLIPANTFRQISNSAAPFLVKLLADIPIMRKLHLNTFTLDKRFCYIPFTIRKRKCPIEIKV